MFNICYVCIGIVTFVAQRGCPFDRRNIGKRRTLKVLWEMNGYVGRERKLKNVQQQQQVEKKKKELRRDMLSLGGRVCGN